jgi:NAD(P)-dependent dehydrogenase (short-subunit alcohol dehydrogenase family)
MALALDLSGRVVLVTGGTRGIGLGISEAFRAAGARVLTCSRSEVDAPDHYVCDVRDPDAVQGLVTQVVTDAGRLDVLVNNAGIRKYHTVVEASEESWDEILGVNLKGYAFCAKAAIPFIRQGGGGSIVNVASVRSVTSVGKTTQYDTTKAAVAGLTRGMAADHANEGVRVNAVCPGPIYTPFHEQRIREMGRTFEQYREDAAKGTLLRRPGTPEEVAACILFLASDDASYVTGTLLFVDGGFTAM